MKGKVLITAALLIAGNLALAQTACPQGVAAGGAQCGPATLVNPKYGERVPPETNILWADRWGAIASDNVATYGIVTDLPSKRKARRAAVDECKRRGGGDCVVAREFVNQCAVVIAGDSGTNIVNAVTVKRATHLAMQDCESQGNKSCWIFWSGCSLAQRIQ